MLEMPAPLGQRTRLGQWPWYLVHYALPGAFFLCVAISNFLLVVELWNRSSTGGSIPREALIAQRALFTVFYGLIAVLFAIRRPRLGEHAALVPAIVALVGSFILGLHSLMPITQQSSVVATGGVALNLVGLVFSIVSLAYLGRCFGVFPEARGLVTRGPYRWVRHPLYLAEIVSALGILLPTISAYTGALFVVFVALQYRRALYEEETLARVFPKYADYSRRTWRIIPGIH